MSSAPSTSEIKEWRSIVVLIFFVLTNLVVLFPFNIPIPVPRSIWNLWLDTLARMRIIQPRRKASHGDKTGEAIAYEETGLKWLRFPMNFLTAPLIADLLLLAMTAIGRTEVYAGTIGSDHIYPIEIMAFFITLAYIAISLDVSGLIRWLALKVLQKSGSTGHLLFLYLYTFFFSLASFIGNDPIVLSGTPFLAYMTRLSANIREPKAWIFTQFSIANIASAILVTSNPTNLVLAGAFKIKFIDYTANMIVPVIITVILYFPFLLYYVFRDKSLVPKKIEMHQLSDDEKRDPTNPNIPYAGGIVEDDKDPNTEEGKLLSLEEIMNPYLDKKVAIFASVIMAITLIAILVLNASSSKEYPAFYVTVPAAVIVFCWEVYLGWKGREASRQIYRDGKEKFDRRHALGRRLSIVEREAKAGNVNIQPQEHIAEESNESPISDEDAKSKELVAEEEDEQVLAEGSEGQSHQDTNNNEPPQKEAEAKLDQIDTNTSHPPPPQELSNTSSSDEIDEKALKPDSEPQPERQSLSTLIPAWWFRARITFPTVTTVLSLLPLPLVPFSLCMFVLVQALVTKGWITVFAYGWNAWVNASGTVGAIGGMGFLSVILCNFAGTNIGTTILLCRVLQEWYIIHQASGTPISDRTFWASVYSMAIGLNYGAFSTAFSASLAGMLWRTILARKYINVRARDFTIVNLRLIAFTMVIGLVVLIGEVYIFYKTTAYHMSG